MGRLTRKSLEYTNTWIADGSLSNIEGVVRGRAIDRLAEFEDFMEEMGFESLEELKFRIEYYKDTIDNQKFNYDNLHKYKNLLQHENQALKERWQKILQLIKEIEDKPFKNLKPLYVRGYKDCIKKIKNEMQELEKED